MRTEIGFLSSSFRDTNPLDMNGLYALDIGNVGDTKVLTNPTDIGLCSNIGEADPRCSFIQLAIKCPFQ